MASIVVPPGGFAGFSQMTAASRRALMPGRSATRSNGRRSRRSAPRTTRRARSSSRPSARRASSGRKLKFGSPAWQKKYRVGKFAKRRGR